MIPDGWKIVRFGDIVTYSQYGLSKATTKEGNTFILGMSNIIDGKIVVNELNSVLLSETERDAYLLVTGDILFNRTNSYDLVGKTALFESGVPLVCASYIVRFQLDTLCALPKYVCYFFNKADSQRKLKSLATPGVSQCNINPTTLKRYFWIPLPSLDEQEEITAILSTWDHAIDQVQKLVDAKTRLKKGLMQQLMTGRMRIKKSSQRDSEIGHAQKDWEFLRASKLFSRQSKKGSGDEKVLSVTQDIGIVPRDSLERKINMTDSNTNTYKLVEPGDFVISLRSFQGGIEYSGYEGVVSPAYHVIRPSVEVCADFYKHYFKSYEFIGHLAIAVIGIRDGKQISYDDFAFMKIPYPPVSEQRRIAQILSECDSEIDLLTTQLENLNSQKKGLMQVLLTGKVRVTPNKTKGGAK